MATGLEPFFPLIAATVGAAVVSAGGLVIGRKLGLTPAQAQYVDTLEGLNEALQTKLKIQETDFEKCKEHGVAVESELRAEQDLSASLKQEVFELRQELADRRRSARSKKPEVSSDA